MSVAKAKRFQATQSVNTTNSRAMAQKQEAIQSKSSTRATKIHNLLPLPAKRAWTRTAIWLALIALPTVIFVFTFYIWQLNTTLSQITITDNKIAENLKSAPQQYIARGKTSNNKSSRLNFAQIQNNNQIDVKDNESYPTRNISYLHNSLIYTSILLVIISLCIVVILVSFLIQDKRYRKQYQTLLDKADSIVENRIRSRTARSKSAQKLAEKERQRAELLLQDSSHRIGNSLATVSSLLGLQLRRSQDEQVKMALTSARDRIQTISAAHRRLRLNKDMETVSAGDFFNAVIHDVEEGLTINQRRHIIIQTRFEHWLLPARDVTTLGIILGELLTNAVKHAFPNNRSGKIYVSFGKLSSKNLRLIVEDDGIGFITPKSEEKCTAEHNSQGLGKLIISQLSMQFDAKPQFTNSKKGGSRTVIPLLKIKAEHGKH